MSEPVVHATDLTIHVRVTATSYKGERWFSAMGGSADYADIAHGRSPERAVSFLLDKLSEFFRSGNAKLTEPRNTGITAEILEVVKA